LRSDNVEAKLDLLRPSDGLAQLCIEGRSPGPAQFLGIQLPSGTSVDPSKLVESFVRGQDLVVSCAGWDSWPIHLQVVWRAIRPGERGQPMLTIDCVVSVRTELLDSCPEMAVRGSLQASQVLRLVGPDSGSFREVDMGESLVLHPRDGPSCLLFHLQELPVSYLEMVHPADFCEDELSVGSGQNHFQFHHQLFHHRLEKGVIFRARVRGVLFPSGGDLSSAGAWYQDFAAADPPLSD
jgi:hypothetical protein